jgi:hypothetical protein
VFLGSFASSLKIGRLAGGGLREPGRWPKLSVVVAACDEGQTIEQALRSLMAQDYPELELVVVDDRSSDDTGRIVERLAREDDRLRPVRVDQLPPGWLGKVHALQCGLDQAGGEWVLFTDADVHFGPGLLQRSLQYVLAEGLDHLVLIPNIVARSFWLRVLVQTFAVGFLHLTGAHRVGEPESDAAIGAGAFNLFRRAALDSSEGLRWLRMEVADDVGLGLVLRRAGARGGLLFALDQLSVEWYPSVGAMLAGLEKNAFSVAEYRTGRLLTIVVASWVFGAAPLLPLLLPGVGWLWPAGIACYLVLALLAAAWRLRLGQAVAPMLLFQAGHFLLSLALLRSGLRCLQRGGIEWRGTRYSLQELRRGQRVKLMRSRRRLVS